MYQRATKRRNFDQRTSSLVCGKVFSGSMRQVNALLKMHARVCRECAADFESEVEIHYVEPTEKDYVNPTFIHRTGEFFKNFEDAVDSAGMNAEDLIFYRQLGAHLTTDMTLNSSFYTTPEDALARRVEQTGVFYESIAFTENECVEFMDNMMLIKTDTAEKKIFVDRMAVDCSYDLLLNPQCWRNGGANERKLKIMNRIVRDMGCDVGSI
jgi:hypothetical protein